ncbi:MAG: heat-inducible transcriptional repressor HrcA [Alphaproteobacteria bacterium]
MIAELDARAREILRLVVDAYVATGAPVGSKALAQKLGLDLSSATIRGVMADLEELGLLRAPHVSAGRVPTEAGLRLFVDGILEVGALGPEEQSLIEAECQAGGRSLPDILARATQKLAGLSSCAGLVLAPKSDRGLRQIDFVSLGPGRVLVILVTEDGLVENRVIETSLDLPPASLGMAANYLNARLAGRTLGEVHGLVQAEIAAHQAALDELTAKLVTSGLAIWAAGQPGGQLILRGQAHLLQDIQALDEVEQVRKLFEALETREGMMRLLETTGEAPGVKIFIGSENAAFAATGYSLVLAPYINSREQIIGAVGVVGPTRLNYARIVPMVDYTAKLIGGLLG